MAVMIWQGNGLAFTGQNSAEKDSLILIDIVFIGNDKTKDVVLRREIKSRIGQPVDWNQVEEDRKRIQNLRLFTRVQVQPVRTDEGIVLLFYVAERWYIFPFPILYYNERDVKKLSYGLGVLHENFRGMNQRVAGSFWLGYNPGTDFYYYNPWFGGEKQLYSRIKFYHIEKKSKSLAYERFAEKHQGFMLMLGKRWGYHTYLTGLAAYQNVRLPDEYKGLTVSATGEDHLPSLGLSFLYDTRDLYEYPKDGWYINLQANKSYYPGTVDFVRFGLDLRRYVPIWKSVSIAGRLAGDYSMGDIPIYNHLYLGYRERIRGHFNARREGENRLLMSWELRFPILKIRYFNLGKASSFLGGYGSNLPFGISGGLFYDTGAVWMQDRLTANDFLTGFGFGLHIHLPYIELFRIEYAFNTGGKPELVLDVGVWF